MADVFLQLSVEDHTMRWRRAAHHRERAGGRGVRL